MAEISYTCSAEQAFNWDKNNQSVIGHLTALKVGGEDIEAKFELMNPEKVGEKNKVVGPISYINWKGGYADAIQIDAQVHNENQQDLMTLLQKDLDSTAVEFKFEIFAYHQEKGNEKYFQCFHCDDKTLYGLIHKDGEKLDIFIDKKQSQQILSPKNFSFSIKIMPAEDEAQVLHWAGKLDGKLSKAWGITS